MNNLVAEVRMRDLSILLDGPVVEEILAVRSNILGSVFLPYYYVRT